MTTRLYYDDSHTFRFEARVLEKLSWGEGQSAIVLDRTYFYPLGGGQPHDTGYLNGIKVVDVQSRADDGAVIHILEKLLEDDTVEAVIDSDRRLRHMRHHTGQHILTQAFVQTAGYQTVGFHLGSDTVTIDLDTPTISQATLAAAEALANNIILENRTVTASIIEPENSDDVRMRKMPDQLMTNGLRVIEVAGFDRTACGGTHVADTGEIGLLKITKTEKRGEHTRVEFRCGQAAIADYTHKHTLLDELSNMLTCGISDLPEIVAKLQGDLQQAHKALSTAQDLLIGYKAEKLLSQAQIANDVRIITYVEPNDGDVRALASQLVEAPKTVVFLAATGERLQIITACSDDVEADMRDAFSLVAEYIDGVRGGGRPHFVQGGGAAQPADELATTLQTVAEAWQHTYSLGNS